MLKQNYDDSSISQLKGAERVRKRPEALLGSRGLDGAIHTIQEIIGNATDERLAGFGDKIELTYHDDKSISVRDYGRGVPLGWNEKEKEWNYKLIYAELYAGGKYSDNQKILHDINDRNAWSSFRITDYPYLISIGLNGLGSAISQYSSEFFTVCSYRDGVVSRMEFEKGEPILDKLVIEKTDEPNGTYIHWKPDNAVFSDTNIPDKWFENTAKALSFVSGFNVTLNIRGNVKTYESSSIEEELKNDVGECVSNHSFTHIIDAENDVCICDVEVAVGPAGRQNDYYHNKISIRGGAHANGVNLALMYFFKDVSSKYGIRITPNDYSNSFSIIVSTLANKASLRNQTKDSIDDVWISNAIQNTIYDVISKEWRKSSPWISKIVENVVQEARNRIALAEMNKSLKEIQKVTTKHKTSEKFVTCRSYESGRAEETEFFIVEGDSAGGSVLRARDANYQCMLKIRGKSLNIFKAPIAKLVANREILDIISILGCGIELGIDGFKSFDLDALKVGKIIFASDADVDGYHIRILLFLIMYKLFPQLLSNGNVWVAEAPLYVLNMKDNTFVYCMTESELNEKLEEVGRSNVRTIDRFKGLGECEPSVLWSTTLNPATRNMRQIKIDPEDMSIHEALEVLFGKSTEVRKRAILGQMLGTDFDETLESIDDIIGHIESLDLNQNLDVEEVTY